MGTPLCDPPEGPLSKNAAPRWGVPREKNPGGYNHPPPTQKGCGKSSPGRMFPQKGSPHGAHKKYAPPPFFFPIIKGFQKTVGAPPRCVTQKPRVYTKEPFFGPPSGFFPKKPLFPPGVSPGGNPGGKKSPPLEYLPPFGAPPWGAPFGGWFPKGTQKMRWPPRLFQIPEMFKKYFFFLAPPKVATSPGKNPWGIGGLGAPRNGPFQKGTHTLGKVLFPPEGSLWEPMPPVSLGVQKELRESPSPRFYPGPWKKKGSWPRSPPGILGKKFPSPPGRIGPKGPQGSPGPLWFPPGSCRPLGPWKNPRLPQIGSREFPAVN